MARYYRTADELGIQLHLRSGFLSQAIGNGILIQHPGGFTCSILKLEHPGERPTTAELYERTERRRWQMFSTWEPTQ